MKDEFLYRWPGARHLMNLKELEDRMDKIFLERFQAMFGMIEEMDQIMFEQFKKESTIMDNIMVDVFDSKILRRDNGQQATLGKMSIASVVQKFH